MQPSVYMEAQSGPVLSATAAPVKLETNVEPMMIHPRKEKSIRVLSKSHVLPTNYMKHHPRWKDMRSQHYLQMRACDFPAVMKICCGERK